MPYSITVVAELWDDDDESRDHAVLEAHLNEREAEGWKLVTVVPDWQFWDSEGMANGKGPATLVFHRD